MPRKPLQWVGSALSDLRAFPAKARSRAGHELDLLQQGLDPTDFKPMPGVGMGAYELRIRVDGAFRVFYVAKFAEGIHVLHAFEKKTKQTARVDIEVGAKRYRLLMKQRRSH